jgi:hypothetical protein
MNSHLLAIDNMFAKTNAIGPVQSKTAVVKSEHFSLTSSENTPSINTPGTETFGKKFNKEIQQQLGPTLSKEIATKVPQKANISKSVKGQNPTVQPGIVQLWLVQYSLNTEQGKEGIARKVEPKAGYELAQMLTSLTPDKIPALAVKTAKLNKNESLLTIDQGKIGLKATLPETSNAWFATDVPLNKGANTNIIQSSNKILFTAKDPTGQENAKKLIPETHVEAGNKIATAGKIPPIPGKPIVGNDQKAPILNPSSTPAPDKSPDLQFQFTGLFTEKPPLIAEKAVDIKINPAQQDQVVTDDVIKQGETSPANHVFQEMHRPQIQVSTGQTKDHDSSTSNNRSNSGFEQMFSANNAQSTISEQSSALPEAIKTDNLPSQTSPTTDTASITEQIQSSINSSLRQGDQQISIRLNPPELGKVVIEFKQQEQEITGLVEVSKTQTKYEVEQALPQIIQNLADCGIEIKRLEVMLSDGQQSGQQALKDQSLQDGWAQEQSPANPGGETNNTPANQRLTNENSYAGLNELQEVFVTNNSINILI